MQDVGCLVCPEKFYLMKVISKLVSELEMKASSYRDIEFKSIKNVVWEAIEPDNIYVSGKKC